ncbi:hypothetical protein GEMRC1_000607 [Eukaryota sp. GEM-RC1]
MNIQAIDQSLEHLVEIEVDPKWADGSSFVHTDIEGAPEIFNDVFLRAQRKLAQDIPVSKVMSLVDGKYPTDTSKHERRRVGLTAPTWDSTSCISCNACVNACPHQSIRNFAVSEEQKADLPEGFVTTPLKGKKNLEHRIQVAPNDCLGCTVCTTVCPKNCLTMEPTQEVAEKEEQNWDYAIEKLDNEKLGLGNNKNYKDLGFKEPYLFSSGACMGCNQPVITAVLYRMFGQSVVLAQAVGCSMVWQNFAPISATGRDKKGHGPTLSTSLFEDNAEFAFGMYVGTERRRKRLLTAAEQFSTKNTGEFAELVGKWTGSFNDLYQSKEIGDVILEKLPTQDTSDKFIKLLNDEQDLLGKKVYACIGGDGWANDIDVHGLLHVLASGANIKVIVFDTEVYSNTGGQASKATPQGASGKFIMGGNKRSKMDIAQMVTSFGNVYVGSISSGYDMNHTIKTIREAVEYDGPALVVALTPCIAWGVDLSNSVSIMKEAVETGFWPLYRFDPRLKGKKNPLQVDYKKELKPLQPFLAKQGRFSGLQRSNEKVATELQGELEKHVVERHQRLLTLSQL